MTSRIQWLGSARGQLGQGPCRAPPCPPGTFKAFDWACPEGQVRCEPGPIDPGACGEGLAWNAGYGRCIPITCAGTGNVRNFQTGLCEPEGAPQAPPSGTNVPCGPGKEAYWDAGTQSIKCRGVLVAGGVEVRACRPDQIVGVAPAGCVPYACPPGTVRNSATGDCVTACPPGQVRSPTTLQCEPVTSCLTPAQVAAAQPCFYFDDQLRYVGPPQLWTQRPDELRQFCLDSYGAGYFDQPLCPDALSVVPPPPTCIDPETRRVLRYCRDQGFDGDDRAANYFCWFALKAPDKLAAWENTPDCPPGTSPSSTTTPAPAKKSSAGPLIIAGIVAAGVAYYLLS